MEMCQQCKKRERAKGRKKCKTCERANYRRKYPMKAAYDNLKKNAKRRGHDFTLTYEQFADFATATDYIIKKGKQVDSFSIDRIDNDKGYSIDNIRILTLSDNSKKHTKKVVFDISQRNYFTAHLYQNSLNYEPCPF